MGNGSTFPLEAGTPLAGGVVEFLTLTSYAVRVDGDLQFVPFPKVHPTVPATPLVVFGQVRAR